MGTLFTEVRPVLPSQHRGVSLDRSAGYRFARRQTVAPLITREFAQAVPDYAIVFVRGAEGVAPMALLGVETGRNLFVDAAGNWAEGCYIPAIFRQYPFAVGRLKDDGTCVLSIDEACEALRRDGSGTALFDAEGKPSELLESSQSFAQEMSEGAARTQLFCARLEELDLLAPARIRIEQPGGATRESGGALAVSREKLAALPPQELQQLLLTGGLELIYMHLASLANLRRLAPRLASAGKIMFRGSVRGGGDAAANPA